MRNNILIPYSFASEESECIALHFNHHPDWVKTIFDPIKDNIIAHLRIQQDNSCCYCKYQLGFDIKEVDIEHIVPKSEYEKFTFESRNLALSCPACNTKKSTKPVLQRLIVNYPRNGNHFKIVHAHYDNYSDHIDIIDNCVFVAKTTKGSETITFCELFRLRIVEEKVKAYQKGSPNILSQLVAELATASVDEKQTLVNVILDNIR